MCGINGFTFSDRALIEKMNALVKSRGPDGDGVFVDHSVSLGHTRLAIIDLSEKGKQPMFYPPAQQDGPRRSPWGEGGFQCTTGLPTGLHNNGNFVLTFNGEIYNFQDLRRGLEEKGYSFLSQTDSEVILALYQEYGPECVKHLNGIFAFAIWDRREKELFLARDHVGVKPLYYCERGKDLIFSSEIKAILAHDVPRRLDREALNIYLRMLYVPAPLTMFQGIKKLEPGSYLVYKNGEIKINKYWQPTDFTDLTDREEARERIRALMKDAVRLQLISDRPVGVFLSGGIDSTAITGLVTEHTRSTVKTFSVGFDIWPEKYNADAVLAQKTSQHFSTDHHEFIITGKDVVNTLPEVVYHMDEPVANATQIATYLLAKHTREHVVVGLGGDGGDELFGGYERYRLSRLISRFQRLPLVAQKMAMRFLLGEKGKAKKREKLQLPAGFQRYLAFMAQKEDDVGRVLTSELNDKGAVSDLFVENYFQSIVSSPDASIGTGPKSEVHKDFEKFFMWADVRSWLVDESLIRTDKMTMAHGLEQRVPILDHRLVELSLKIPTQWKIRGKEGKVIFKEAMKEYLPDHVLNQPKRGWTSPASEWLRRELKDLAYEALSPGYNDGTSKLFDFNKIKMMLDAHIAKEAYHMNLLWALLHFQLWHRRFKVEL